MDGVDQHLGCDVNNEIIRQQAKGSTLSDFAREWAGLVCTKGSFSHGGKEPADSKLG